MVAGVEVNEKVFIIKPTTKLMFIKRNQIHLLSLSRNCTSYSFS